MIKITAQDHSKILKLQARAGFTLIELLIVITIIGILAGIIITILNPAGTQNRARDGVVVATINKVAADVKAYSSSDISGQLALPNCAQLAGTLPSPACTNPSLENVATCICNGAADRTDFTINGVTTGALAVTGDTGFQYRFNIAARQFCLAAPANFVNGLNTWILYDPDNMSGNGRIPTPARSADDCY